MINPMTRWPPGMKPPCAGLPTYAALPYTEDPSELPGLDVAIVGAPMDDLVTSRPGTRFGPKAIPGERCQRTAHRRRWH